MRNQTFASKLGLGQWDSFEVRQRRLTWIAFAFGGFYCFFWTFVDEIVLMAFLDTGLATTLK